MTLQDELCSLFAQDALTSHFSCEPLLVNPAFAGQRDYNRVNVGLRDQWPALNHAFVSYFASYDQRVPTINSGIGVMLMRDVAAGRYSRTSAALSYNYRFKLNRRLTIAPALEAAIVQRAVKTSGLTLPDDNPYGGSAPSETLADKSSVFPDFACGVIASLSDSYTAGISIRHLNSPTETLSELNDKRTPMSLSAHFNAKIPFRFGKFDDERMDFMPGIYYCRQQYQQFFSLGLNVSYRNVFLGVWSRSADRILPQSIIFLAGVEQNLFKIVYSYDSGFSYGNLAGGGAHEVTLTLKIFPKKKIRAIKCAKKSY